MRVPLLLLSCLAGLPAVAEPAPAFDVNAVVRQAHFAWRADGAGWESTDATFIARARDGALTFTPRQGATDGAAVRFGPPVLTRGGRLVASRAEKASVDARGQLLRPQGAVVEELEAAEQGVEQRWRFAVAPAGQGPLTVRIPVAAPTKGQTTHGLHFAAGPLVVRYGHGTWVDAQGRRTAVEARLVRGAIELEVPERVLATSAFPAVLDPVIGPEFQVDQPVLRGATNSQSLPAVATNGTDWLVAWQDDRRGNGSSDIYAARVSASGALLDPIGLEVCTHGGPQNNPKVAFDGLNYLVVWAEDVNSSFAGVHVARVSPTGVVLDPQGQRVSPQRTGLSKPAVTFDGTNALVVWASGIEIQATRVSRQGLALDTPPLTLTTVGTNPAVASGGGVSLVTWNVGGEIAGVRLAPSGARLDATPLAITSQGGLPAVDFDGDDFLVVWVSASNGAVAGASRTPRAASSCRRATPWPRTAAAGWWRGPTTATRLRRWRTTTSTRPSCGPTAAWCTAARCSPRGAASRPAPSSRRTAPATS